MLQRLKLMLETVDKVATSTLQKALAEASITAIEIDQLTREEAELVSRYLKRDLHDAGKFLRQSGKDLINWLAFDLELAEARTWEAFLSVADKSQLAWLAMQQKMQLGDEYHTGEITSIGTLYCTHCTKQMNFYQTTRIPPCPKCHKTSFIRGQSR